MQRPLHAALRRAPGLPRHKREADRLFRLAQQITRRLAGEGAAAQRNEAGQDTVYLVERHKAGQLLPVDHGGHQI